MKKKKILLISQSFALEGSVKSLFYLAISLKKQGYEVSVYSAKQGPIGEAYKKNNIRVIHLGIEQWGKKSDYIVVNTIIGYKFINKYPKHSHKILWCIRESEREVYFKENKELNESIFAQVKNVIFVADATRRIYEDINVKNNFVTIHNGIDISKIDNYKKSHTKTTIRSKYGYNTNDILIGIIGTLCLRKGQLEFIEAALQVLENKRKGRNIKFLIIGEQKDARYTERIKSISQKYADDIIFVEETPAIFDYYGMLDMFICNSYIESFPRVVLEAMGFQLPIIATDVYGISEQIRDNVDGILIHAGDIKNLSEKMIYLLDNPDEGEKMAYGAYIRVCEEFSHERVLEKYIKILK